MHLYSRDADDTLEWIVEKDVNISCDDYGHDLESTQTLVSRHDGLEVCFVLLPTLHDCIFGTCSCCTHTHIYIYMCICKVCIFSCTCMWIFLHISAHIDACLLFFKDIVNMYV